MRVPASTYRLQITARFDLFAAAELLPYLHDLGVDWVYLSPILEAEPGSDHGYDVVSFGRIDPARGGAAGLDAVSAAARRLGMGVLVDIVPNHMGVATPRHNQLWWSLLREGRSSRAAAYFDVDWDFGDGRIRLPILGDDGLSAVTVHPDEGVVRYHDHELPLAPGTSTLEEQHYELVHWSRADADLNWRRFFAVTTLAGVRVEDPAVFDATHEEIRRWFDAGLVDGLRVDHPDGLLDPEAYLASLATLTDGAYVLVEKILEPGETLPSWATAGTTGYDALALVDRLLTDPSGQGALDALEARLRGHDVHWPTLIHDTKRAMADGILRSEVRRVVREIRSSVVEPSSVVERSRDHLTDEDLVDAVAELAACFPVYRSYLPGGSDHLEEAVAATRARRPDLAGALEVVVPVLSDAASPAAQRFQQTTGAIMAKGVEDTAFYRWSRLTSLNEVGADPSIFSLSVSRWHEAMAERQRDWPHAMTTLSTHDTKRGEDVRARIAVLAEIPHDWAHALDRLLAVAPLPDEGFGSLLWQAAVGAWPIPRERLHAYAEKAMREAGDRTTWTAPDEAYEQAVHAAVDAAYDDPRVREVLDEVVAQVAGPGWVNSLSAKLVALTMPGVPDVYQGSELWEQSLVDPDNRRDVDFGLRRSLLDQVRSGERPALGGSVDDSGAAKLLVSQAALTLRREQPHRFTTYEPVLAEGPAADHVVAFDRGGALTVATRLPVGLASRGWGDTTLDLPDGTWTDLLGGRSHNGAAPVHDFLADHPVALLVREDA